ncbi:archaetidylserine decarboxylase [Leeia sp. TBRC 13508]|uniref:Phosphatidylserine decarboxylase proenzyme n=1 Tax=Leeia speluncae TaxID=2884804 RepID=A0ABS8D9V4_9NEIS|nr:archaetidylserine decarboxylase [Leeia speluncae]MCB6184981.1 archaetidylserine decarboxylase [Leeia speluncae]
MSKWLFVKLQHILPKLLITQLFGYFASLKAGALTHFVIRRFIKQYNVDMNEALESKPSAFPTFNQFFTRELRPGLRPLANADLICPVDGRISQFGKIQKDQIFQAKGKSYSLNALLGGKDKTAVQYENGLFATVYLSPKDYHRIHMPCDGKLVSMSLVPGALFSVNPTTVEGVDALFARNERLVCHFESPNGPFVLILVGATIVGSIATVWHGVVNQKRGSEVKTWTYENQDISLKKGDEMGRFLLGSTIILLTPPNTMAFNPSWEPMKLVKLGEEMLNIK